MQSTSSILLQVVGLTGSQIHPGAFALILGDISGKYRIPVVIGNSEAQAIAVNIENVSLSRPLIHDVFAQLIAHSNITFLRVDIHHYEKGIYYANLVFTLPQSNAPIYIDSRTSDAVALALRVGVPIYTTLKVIEEARLQVGDELPIEEPEEDENNFLILSDQKLFTLLADAVEKEEYEKAALIKKEMGRREKKS